MMKPVLAKERAFYCKKNIELLRYQFNLIIIFLHFFSRVLFHCAENFFWVGNFLSVDVDFYFGIGLIHNFTHSLNGIVGRIRAEFVFVYHTVALRGKH